MNKDSTPDSFDSSTFSGENNEDVREDKSFDDTQVVDFDDETQLMDLGDEMQDIELAGETQVMDDYDFIENMDTQVIDVSDNETECRSYGEGSEKTQLWHDIDKIQGICGDETTSSAENGTRNCCQDDGEVTKESLPSMDSARGSGDLRRGFTAINPASLRAAGIAAERKTSKDSDGESFSIAFSSGSANADTVYVEHNMEKGNAKELRNENKSKVARSLVGKLFVEEDLSEEGSHNSYSSQRTDTHQLPICDDEFAGLSYVDSQEPGELSQANAMEFIDKFLKTNVLESNQDKTCKNAVGETVSPGTIAKGPQSLAQQANHQSILTGATVFDWDDMHEDEGGGVFFIKKKKQLIGTSCRAQKCSAKSQSSRQHELQGSEYVRKLKNEKEKKKIHDKVRGSIHSNSKLVNSIKIGQLEETNGKKDIDEYSDQRLALDRGHREAPNAVLVDMQNVGIDTQMAAEAMEALSTGGALLMIDSSVTDQDQENGRKMCEKELSKKGMLKKCTIGRRPCLSYSDLGTRSKRTKPSTRNSCEEPEPSIALRTHSKLIIEELNDDVLKPKGYQRRLNLKNICAENQQESSDKRRENALERGLFKNGSLPVKRRSLRDKISSSTLVVQKDRQHMNVNNLNSADDASGYSRVQRDCVYMAQDGRVKRTHSTTNYVASENVNARDEALNLISETDMKVDGSSDRGRDVTSNPITGSAKNKSLLDSVGHEVVLQSIRRQTRSKCNAQSVKVPQEGEGVHSGDMLSVEDPCQSSLKKHEACSPPANRLAPHSALVKPPEVVQKLSSSANVTPINLKTPRSAVSPVCVGDEYPRSSCKKVLSLKKEFYRLTSTEPVSCSPFKDLRPKRHISSIRVLFSQHLDEEIIRQQKKILTRLGVAVCSSISDATHFVADGFVRTRNMLEAIANGKPVVTHLWLESCGQASCYIDERNYILRDAKKERELGFSMPISLTRASRHPLFEGRRVFITPNTKPGKEILSSLVKAVHGLATERLSRSMSNDNRLLDDLLVLSCEEDFEECVPLLEKGIAVYSSELLLNGIITQRLEYERYRIFVDHVKKTRSTLWVKKNGEQFVPVKKAK